MMKSFKRIAAKGLVVLMLLGLLSIPALAAGPVTLDLSKTSGYAGDSVTLSGTAGAGQWVSMKAMDADGNLVYFSAALCDSAGAYSDSWVVPDLQPGQLQIIAGYGSDVVSADFTVKKHTSNPGGLPGGGPAGGEDKDEDQADDDSGAGSTIKDNAGNEISGTITKTDDSVKVDVPRAAFNEAADTGRLMIDTGDVLFHFYDMALYEISKTADGGNISLTVETLDPLKLFPGAENILGDRPVYDFTLMAGSTQITELGGRVSINIPYALRDGENPNAVVIYYVDDYGNLKAVRGRYNPDTGSVNFSVTHFSVYAVGYNEVMFDDVSDGDWYYDAVTFCAAREITTGTGNNLFSPDAALSRGQFVVLLMRAYGLEADANGADNFDDAGDTYYTGYLSAAKRLGLTNGVGNNLFAPDSEITRQDMVTLVYRALNVLGEWPEADGAGSLSDFSDAGRVADYAQEAMEMLYRAGVISGSDGKLLPQGNSTRAQMAQVLYNLLRL